MVEIWSFEKQKALSELMHGNGQPNGRTYSVSVEIASRLWKLYYLEYPEFLILFRKRDKRVVAHKKKLEERAKENKNKVLGTMKAKYLNAELKLHIYTYLQSFVSCFIASIVFLFV